jgi:cathepsin X
VLTDCGSCWAHAATSSLSDRLLIANKGQGQQINLAPQYLLNCGNDSSIGRDVGSCHGGSAIRSFEYIAKHGIVDETCCPYQAKNLFVRSKAETCVPDMICRNCDHTGCWAVPEGDGPAHHRRAYVTEYGPAKGEHAMMAEVFARGPIACVVPGCMHLLPPRACAPSHVALLTLRGRRDDDADDDEPFMLTADVAAGVRCVCAVA